jgi:hypothetical protein
MKICNICEFDCVDPRLWGGLELVSVLLWYSCKDFLPSNATEWLGHVEGP